VLVAATHDAEHRRMLRALGLLSAMIVPLRTPERIVGAITFIAAESRRHYDQRDLAFAESLAERAANAIHAADLYQEAQHANRAKSEFLAVMSHELRTPLNAILGYTDLLTEGISGTLNDRQQEQMLRIDASARHLTQLIDTVLAFARIEAGRDEVSISEFDAAEAAREAIAYIAPAADRKGLTIDVRCIRSVQLRSDVAKVRQILLNLLSNAVKFTEQGTIEVAVSHTDHRAVISVADSGVGIAPDDLPRIWEPFAQLGHAFTRRTGGTGLGLPVSAGLAQLLGGSIDVTSEEGKGSTFVLRLPIDHSADLARTDRPLAGGPTGDAASARTDRPLAGGPAGDAASPVSHPTRHPGSRAPRD
jgi:signal transduction histidine kinase